MSDETQSRGDPSQSYSEFHGMVQRFVTSGGDIRQVWLTIDDLGRQIAEVRHDQRNQASHIQGLDFRLFGYVQDDGVGRGGKFGAIEQAIEAAAVRNEEAVIAQTAELKANIKWIMRIGGVGSLILVGVAIALIATLLHLTPPPR